MKFTKMIGIIIAILLCIGMATAGPYRVDENMEMGTNDIYNATNVNATNLYQDGSKVLDVDDVNGTTFNYTLYANQSLYWDDETTQADLNVNSSTWWASISGWSSTFFEIAANSLEIKMSWFNTSVDARITVAEPDLNVNSSDYWDELNTPADIGSDDITDDGTWIVVGDEGDLNVNSSDYWDDLNTPGDITISDLNQTGEANLNVNSSTWWAEVNGFSSTMFEIVANSLSIKMSWFNTSADARITNAEPNLNVNSSDYWDSLGTPGDILISDLDQSGEEVLDVNRSDYWDNLNTPGDILISDLDQTGEADLNVNYSTTSGTATTWDGETSQADLNVNNSLTSDSALLADDSTAWITMTGLQSKWLADVGNVLTFDEAELNSSIVEALTTQYFNASTITVSTGTGAGTLAYINAYDSIPYNITEDGSAFNFILNYSGVTGLNQIVIRYKTIISEPGTAIVYLYDYDDVDWESYATLTDTQGDYVVKTIGIFDEGDHISGGIARINIRLAASSPPYTHKWNFDWVTLSDGVATPAGKEIDPYSIHKTGNVALTANWDAGSYDITARTFNGSWNGSDTVGINASLLSTGEIADARIPSGITRDTELANTTPITLTGTTYGLMVCADGELLQYNGTTSAWECEEVAGTGTVTSIDTGYGLQGGPITAAGTVLINKSVLNSDFYNQSFANDTFIPQTTEGDLNVNSSDYWDALGTPSDITGLDSDNIDSLNASKINNFDIAGPDTSYYAYIINMSNESISYVSVGTHALLNDGDTATGNYTFNDNINITKNLSVGGTVYTNYIDSTTGDIIFNPDFSGVQIIKWGRNSMEFIKLSSAQVNVNSNVSTAVLSLNGITNSSAVARDAALILDADDDKSIFFRLNGTQKYALVSDRGNDDLRLNNASNDAIIIFEQNGSFWVKGDVSAESLTVDGTVYTNYIDSTSGDIIFNQDFSDNDVFVLGRNSNEYIQLRPSTVDIYSNISNVQLWLHGTTDSSAVTRDALILLDADDDSKISFRLNGTEKYLLSSDRGGGDLRIQNASQHLIMSFEQNGSFWVKGDVSGESFTDRTRAPKDSVDVLSELKKIKVDNTKCDGNKCEIDKSSLPVEMVKPYQECVEFIDVFDNQTNTTEKECIQEETKLGRDLTYTVSHILKQNQLLLERIEMLETELCADKKYTFCGEE